MDIENIYFCQEEQYHSSSAAIICLISISIQYVGLTCGMFTRDGVEIACPDSAAGLYIRTRNNQIVKVYILLLELQLMLDIKMIKK